jgi:hypothetical protein
MGLYDANYNITKLKKSNGEVSELALNGVNIPLAGDVKIEAKKEVTIKVSEYTEPIEITPSSGKDGIAKVIVTLDTSEGE